MKRKKTGTENNNLIVMALANFICAEAGRSGGLSRQVDIAGISATLGASDKDRRAAYKRARKTLAAFM
jgi:hypothetical protein